jgi:hypothetical protein
MRFTTPKWEQGGWVFLIGKPDKNQKSYLFCAPVKYVQTLERKKSDGKSGVPANMVTLYPEFYGIGWDQNTNPVTVKISPSLESIKKHIGLSGYNVVLNEKKTPFWRTTVLEKSLKKNLNDHKMWMLNDPRIVIPYL